MAAMRAIEQGRYLVRSANTGVSGVVDPYGRVHMASDLFVEGAWTADVRLLDGLTVYGRTGDLIVWLSIAVTVVALLICWSFDGRAKVRPYVRRLVAELKFGPTTAGTFIVRRAEL